jgi:glyoxylase-like metal-dependent hydrolase (beta-lactamase superfamily II)
MLHQLTERCYYLPFSDETDRPALGYVRGERFTFLVDGGNSPDHMALLHRSLEEKGLPKEQLVAITHSHWDHTYGLCATEAPVIACRKAQEQLQIMQQWAWTPEAMQARLDKREDILFCHEFILKEYADPMAIRVRSADIVFEDFLELDLGGVHAQLMHLNNSHSSDCAIVFIPEEGVVYLGDTAYKDLHHVPPCWHLNRRAELMGVLDRLDFQWAVPGHHDACRRDDFFRRMEDIFTEDKASGIPVLPD